MIKIYGTLGPCCNRQDIIEKMLLAGMDGMRLNLSHVSLDQARPQLQLLRNAGEKLGRQPLLLIDMQDVPRPERV